MVCAPQFSRRSCREVHWPASRVSIKGGGGCPGGPAAYVEPRTEELLDRDRFVVELVVRWSAREEMGICKPGKALSVTVSHCPCRVLHR